ncbi:xylulokinase [Treponema sp.]
MNKKGIITVDVGTSSLRSVLFDEQGKVLLISRRENPPEFLAEGRVRQDPQSWKRLIPETLRECAQEAAYKGIGIVGLALTAQRSSVIPVDKRGTELYPAIMWQDTNTENICSRMAASHSFVYNKTGLRIYPVFSAVKMTWLKENEGDVYAATHKMLGIQDFMIHDLTGNFVTDQSLASRTNLLNLDTLDWDEELIALFGLKRDLLCDLVAPGSIAGYLTEDAAERTGLVAGLPLISAGGDQQCAALGMGLIGPGRMIANTGTGSYLITASNQAKRDPGMGISCNVAAVPGTFILEAGVITSGSVYHWFHKEFYREAPVSGRKFAVIDAEAAVSPPGANGVILLPHFRGKGSPNWNPLARGAFLNLTPGVTRGDMARSILEGIAAEMGENIQALENMAGKIEIIQVSGGMTASALYNQIQADSYAHRVARSNDAEATALGAWISAAVALGLFPSFEAAWKEASKDSGGEEFIPIKANTEIYQDIAEKRKKLYEGMYPGA